MRYIDLNGTIGDVENVINPNAYLEKLPAFADDLPPGARRFATAPGHYDFFGNRCVKDLKVAQLRMVEDGASFELRLRHNCWKHEDDLTIRYHEIATINIGLTRDARSPAHRDVVLDEVLPHEFGCSHEIACWGGTVHVIAQDLVATWTPAQCPDRPSTP
jgi:hypothetical protein